MASRHDEIPDRRHSAEPKGVRRVAGHVNQYYKVLHSEPDSGFELGEHELSKQLLFVFRGLPNVTLASELEAMGFDHTHDERMFTLDAIASSRQKALQIARRFGSNSQGKAR